MISVAASKPALAGTLPNRWLGVLVVADQLLLPSFHLGPMPFKLSYFALALWFANWLNERTVVDGAADRDFKAFSSLIGGIVFCALCGEIVLAAWYPVSSYGETLRSVTIYALVVLAFGLGTRSASFNLEWLYPALFIAVGLNLIFIFFKAYIPDNIINLYYPADYIQGLALDGVVDARDVLELTRPRGLFGNPNVSALMANVIPLFILVAMRNGVLKVPRPLVGYGVVVLPALVSLCVASRGEFISAALAALLNLQIMMKSWRRPQRLRIFAGLAAIPLMATIALASLLDTKSLIENVDRIVAITSVLDRPTSGAEQADGVVRPLLFFDIALQRAVLSPIFGTGFSSSDVEPFVYITQYFHNDWLRLFVTSGLIGVVLMAAIVIRFCLPLGWPAVIPFFLPGMVNTFQLCIPAIIFYFFMVGALRAKVRGARQQ